MEGHVTHAKLLGPMQVFAAGKAAVGGGLSRRLAPDADVTLQHRQEPLAVGWVAGFHHELMEAEWALVTSLLPLDRLCVWTLNHEALIAKWLERRIGHLTSDNPDLALKLRGTFSSVAWNPSSVT